MNIATHASRAMGRLVPIVVIALLVAACGGGGASAAGIKVTEPWARTSPMIAGAGAAFMIIENSGSAADALVSAKSDVAKAVEVHETYVMASEAPMASEMPAESGAMGGAESPMASAMPAASGATGNTMMGMRKIDKLDIPAGGKVELKPGSYHIMLIELVRELKVGEKVEITLTFEKAGDVKVTAEVRSQ
ncbi:MAG TPA: copper chaperone PCu(A)C [Candidatus Nanopelagicales bacterium]|nr:copper chaperone PCu(A)C [Candidatus Nanopelagicales bacterium]